jgi:hypothetical protein
VVRSMVLRVLVRWLVWFGFAVVRFGVSGARRGVLFFGVVVGFGVRFDGLVGCGLPVVVGFGLGRGWVFGFGGVVRLGVVFEFRLGVLLDDCGVFLVVDLWLFDGWVQVVSVLFH